MLIGISKKYEWLLFTLEKKDFIERKGHKFIDELINTLPDDTFLTIKEDDILIYLIELSEIKTFLDLYKKYFQNDYEEQTFKWI